MKLCNRLIIAFGHRQRVGKNTAAAACLYHLLVRGLCGEIGIRYVSFAAALKRICANMYGWAGLQEAVYYEHNPEEKERILPNIGKTPRQIWIDFGTVAVRWHVWQDTWARLLFAEYPVNHLVISDLRFRNEMDAIHSRGGYCVRIDRPAVAQSHDEADVALDMGGEPWDYIVTNDGDLSQFRQKIYDVTDQIVDNWVGRLQQENP